VAATGNPAAFIVYDISALYEWTAFGGFHLIDGNVAQVSASLQVPETVFIRYRTNLVYEHTGTSCQAGLLAIDSNATQVSAGVDAAGNAAAFIVYDNGALYEWSPVQAFRRVDVHAAQVLASQWAADEAFILSDNLLVFDYRSGVLEPIDQNCTIP
jgi:hypothetical protein